MPYIRSTIVRSVFVVWFIISFGVAGMWDYQQQNTSERLACVEVEMEGEVSGYGK